MISRMLARMRLKTLERLLEEERRLLLAGELHKLVEYAAQKDEALRVIEAIDESVAEPLAESIKSVRDKAARNVGLLKAAMRGFKEGVEAVAALRAEQGALTVYGESGRAEALKTRA
ncbi:hypothetical protein ACMA5I_14885 [Paracoccaceae bacterium GXU_MW_L88]